jgi:hypothetical protein
MNKADQLRIATDVCDSLKEEILKRVDLIPENWDGHEIRQWVADYIKTNHAYMPMPRKRNLDYKNDLYINPNLL